jgi:hypothetical protein
METSSAVRYLEAYSRDTFSGTYEIPNAWDIKGAALG